jgi:hypothetical protein
VKAIIVDLRRSRSFVAGTPVPGRTCSGVRKAATSWDSLEPIRALHSHERSVGDFVTESRFFFGGKKTDLCLYEQERFTFAKVRAFFRIFRTEAEEAR